MAETLNDFDLHLIRHRATALRGAVFWKDELRVWGAAQDVANDVDILLDEIKILREKAELGNTGT